MKSDLDAQDTEDSTVGSASQNLYWIAGIVCLECVIISYLPRPWSANANWKPVLIVFCAVVVLFGGTRLPRATRERRTFSRWFALLHVVALLVAARVYLFLLASAAPHLPLSAPFASLWYASLAFLFVTVTATLASLRYLARTFASLGMVWAYAIACALLVIPLRDFLQSLWDSPQSPLGSFLQSSCVNSVVSALRVLYPRVLYDPNTATVGTPAFVIQIGGACSGVEGLGLMAALGIGSLFFYRRELRIARAAMLVPLSLALVWLLNIVRIVLLIAIGNAGHLEVAIDGFHSAAGWIFFTLAATCFLVLVHRLPWIHKTSPTAPLRNRAPDAAPANTVSASLVPFLAILACSLLTRAVSSGGFEAFYPLRLLVGVAALWFFREQYRSGELAASLRISGRSAWLGPAAGIAIAVLWIASSRVLPASAAVDRTAIALAQLAPWQRLVWLSARVTAAVMIVPLAEELAFRWYLARRLAGAHFQEVPLDRLNPSAILISSFVFGLLHGRMWLAGTLAGVLLALVARKSGRLGDAVIAHAVSNLLLATWILARHDYTLW